MKSDGSGPISQNPRNDRKRRDQKPRVLFSCTSCRQNKLKCDRKTPCSNCVRRCQESSCSYVKCRARTTAVSQNEGHTDGLLLPGGDGGTRYMNHSHWRAIMSILSDRLLARDEKEGSTYHGEDTPDGGQNAQGPVLLLGLPETASKTELLSGLPDRHTADVLVNRYLDSQETSLTFLHAPTFRSQYINFWKDPSKVSLQWLAFLYGVFSCAAWNDYMTNRDSPITLANLPDTIAFYRRQCALCLKCSNYTVPGEYKVEALVQYLGIEYLQSNNLKTGISVLLSMVTHLAILMGYHRDSQPYPHISAFEAEMRRRLWLFLRVTDSTIAWQTGLPRVISMGQADTALPRNLLDGDFGPETTTLPPSRPEDLFPTIVSYMLALERLISISGEILDTSSFNLISDDQTALYNHRLDTARDSIPLPLRLRPSSPSPSPSSTDPDPAGDHSLLLQRYGLELTYQRARCVLHRPYLLYRSSSNSLSRKACVDAARRILTYQSDLFTGVLRTAMRNHRVWFGASISICDCLTASMVISLEVIHQYQVRGRGNREDDEHVQELVGLLRGSYETWKNSPRKSVEIVRAAETMGIMLNLINEHGLGESRGMLGDVRSIAGSPFLDLSNNLNDPALDLFDWDRWDREIQQLNGSLVDLFPPDSGWT